MNFNMKLKFILLTVKRFNLRAYVPAFLTCLVIIFSWHTAVRRWLWALLWMASAVWMLSSGLLLRVES